VTGGHPKSYPRAGFWQADSGAISDNAPDPWNQPIGLSRSRYGKIVRKKINVQG
jgi:hypothetical protein